MSNSGHINTSNRTLTQAASQASKRSLVWPKMILFAFLLFSVAINFFKDKSFFQIVWGWVARTRSPKLPKSHKNGGPATSYKQDHSVQARAFGRSRRRQILPCPQIRQGRVQGNFFSSPGWIISRVAWINNFNLGSPRINNRSCLFNTDSLSWRCHRQIRNLGHRRTGAISQSRANVLQVCSINIFLYWTKMSEANLRYKDQFLAFFSLRSSSVQKYG